MTLQPLLGGLATANAGQPIVFVSEGGFQFDFILFLRRFGHLYSLKLQVDEWLNIPRIRLEYAEDFGKCGIVRTMPASIV
jgi:hypothetical protein